MNTDIKQKKQDVGNILRLGIEQVSKNNLKEAEDLCNHALSIISEHPEALNLLGVIAIHRNQFDKAKKLIKDSLSKDPNNFAPYANLGMISGEIGNYSEAIEYYKKSISLNENNSLLHTNLGSVYIKNADYEEAFQHLEIAIGLDAGNAAAWNNLGIWSQEIGNTEEAVGFFQKSAELNPKDIYAGSNLLFAMHYVSRYSNDDLYNAAIEWSKKYIHAPSRVAHTNERVFDRKLRIGYVSADFREHPVTYAIYSIFKNFNPDKFEIYAYASNRAEDLPRSKYPKVNWHSIAALPDEDAAKLIESHKIDILIDLSGHTTCHRLPLFARKPAPIQATWIGYFDTSGISQMDYVIADPYLILKGEEKYYTEKPAFLPKRISCYAPPSINIKPNDLPARKSGKIMFGCFNNPAKISSETINVWIDILKKVPKSSLYLKSKAFGSNFVCNKFREIFKNGGISPERLVFSGNSNKPEYYASYHDLDIALDPFPYNGATTTLDTLWMGVPIITLKGKNFVSRIGWSILASTGIGELVAESAEEYINKAVELANDLEKLENYRKTLRAKLLSSPTFDDVGLTKDWENLLIKMWRDYIK